MINHDKSKKIQDRQLIHDTQMKYSDPEIVITQKLHNSMLGVLQTTLSEYEDLSLDSDETVTYQIDVTVLQVVMKED